MPRPRAKRANNSGSVYRYPDGRWVARISVGRDSDGRRIRKTVYATSQADAQAKLVELQARYQRGALLPQRGRAPTLRQYLADWLQAHEGKVRPSSALRYKQFLESHIYPDPISRVQLTKLTRLQVEQMLARRQKAGTGISPSTAKNLRAVLVTALNEAVEDGRISGNPAALARPPRAIEREMATLSAEQVRELIERSQDQRDRALWSFLVASGLRVSEALGLRWTDWGEKLEPAGGKREKVWTLAVLRQLIRHDGAYQLQDLKTRGSRRTLRLTELARDALERQRERQSEERAAAGKRWTDGQVSSLLIFRTPAGEPMNASSVTHRFQRWLETTRLPRLRIHDLRHTYATLALAGGAPVLEVSRALGHSTPSMTLNVYGHSSDEGQETLVATLDRALAVQETR